MSRTPAPKSRLSGPPAFAFHTSILFSDVDPAGTAYYPRLIDLCHRAFETFFNEVLETPYSKVIAGGTGFPTAHFEADFQAPLRHGDPLVLEVRVARVGTSSIELSYAARSGKTTAFVARNVVVCVNLKTGRPKKLPPGLKRRLVALVSDAS